LYIVLNQQRRPACSQRECGTDLASARAHRIRRAISHNDVWLYPEASAWLSDKPTKLTSHPRGSSPAWSAFTSTLPPLRRISPAKAFPYNNTPQVAFELCFELFQLKLDTNLLTLRPPLGPSLYVCRSRCACHCSRYMVVSTAKHLYIIYCEHLSKLRDVQ
jgi:hypothetical protein